MKKELLKRRGIFLALVGFLCVISVKAQTWTAPIPEGSVIATGSQYYVYSVGAKAFLDRGGEWDAQAIVTQPVGAIITTVENGLFWNLEYENNIAKCLKIDPLGWTYTDGDATHMWDVQLTDAGNNIYSIQVASTNVNYVAGQFLGTSSVLYNSNKEGAVYDVRYDRTPSDHTKWMFVTADAVAKYNAKVQLDKYMNIAQLVGSSVDLTSYISTYNTGTTADITTAVSNLKAALTVTDQTTTITNPSFVSSPATGWTGSTNYGWSNSVAEFYRKNPFNLYQTVTGLLPGVYVLKAQGFQRPVGLTTANRTSFTNGSDILSAKLYATASGVTTFIPLKSIYSETTCPEGTTVDALFFPNSTANAKAAFDLALYENELGYVIVDGTGSLTLGVSGVYQSVKTGDWQVFDNFRLYYYGALTIPLVSTSKASFAFNGDDNYLSDNLTVLGANLSNTISISAPAGITVSPTSLPANANNETVTITYDGTTAVSGNITFTSGSATKNVAVTASPNTGCYTPLFPSGNLVSNPLCTNLATYDSWGNEAIISDANAYCGSSVRATGRCGGSIDYSLTGKMLPKTTYRLKAMMYTNGNGGGITLNGMGIGGSDANYAVDVNTASVWQAVDFTFTTGTLGASQNFWFNSCGSTKTASDIRMDNFEIYKVPGIRVAEASVPVMSSAVGSSDSKTITVSGNGLTAAVSLALSGANADQFSVSPATLPIVAADSIATTSVSITYTPTGAAVSHVATLTLSSPGAADKIFELSASSSSTGVRPVLSKGSVYVDNRTLKVEGSQSIEVFTAQGLRIAQTKGNNERFSVVLTPGIYIVKLDAGVTKVVVK